VKKDGLAWCDRFGSGRDNCSGGADNGNARRGGKSKETRKGFDDFAEGGRGGRTSTRSNSQSGKSGSKTRGLLGMVRIINQNGMKREVLSTEGIIFSFRSYLKPGGWVKKRKERTQEKTTTTGGGGKKRILVGEKSGRRSPQKHN